MRRLLRFATLLGLAVIAAGCGTERQATPTTRPLPSPTAMPAATGTPVPSATLPATETPEPSQTPLLTHTPLPSATPTRTPRPTATLTPTPGITPTPTVDLTTIGSVSADQVGEEVTVEGTVQSAASFSHGFKLTLEDGSGQIALLMWHDVYDDCWDSSEINLGATVRANGEVSQYEGELQIEPRFGGDVKAVEGAGAQAPRRDIGSISGADEGQRVMIEGHVTRIEGSSSAVKVFLRDDGAAAEGEIVVFIWRNVLDRIARNTGLGTPGSRVRVVGTVQIYRSNLEIVPALPNDVTVLEIP